MKMIPLVRGPIFEKAKVFYINALNELESKADTIGYPEFKYLVEVKYRLKIPQFIFLGIDISKSYKKGFIRIRKLSEIKQDLSLITTYSYPHPAKCKVSQQRANIEDNPVFYGAFLPQTAALELKVDLNEEIALSIWKPKKDKPFNLYLFLGNQSNCSSKLTELNSGLFEKYFSELEGCTKKDREIIEILVHRMTSWFLKNESHKLSSLLGYYLLYDTQLGQYGLSVDAIVYQSIQDKLGGLNIAIHPRAMHKIVLEKVIIGRYQQSNNEGVELIERNCGFNNGLGRLEWKNI